MRQIHIRGAMMVERVTDPASGMHDLKIQGPDDMVVSDGYHSLDELYDHRIELWIALCRLFAIRPNGAGMVFHGKRVWRSRLHSDGSSYAGWFLLGIGIDKGRQITYHLPLAKWDETAFAETRERAPEFDGHSPWDVLERLKTL